MFCDWMLVRCVCEREREKTRDCPALRRALCVVTYGMVRRWGRGREREREIFTLERERLTH